MSGPVDAAMESLTAVLQHHSLLLFPLFDPDCYSRTCDHTELCPVTHVARLCRGCLSLGEQVASPERVEDLVPFAYPCPTVKIVRATFPSRD